MELSVNDLLREKQASDRPAQVVEHFVDSLAARIAYWDEGLTPKQVGGFDPPEARSNYLQIQESSATCIYATGRALGCQLSKLSFMLDTGKSEDMAYTSARFHSKPLMLYMVEPAEVFPVTNCASEQTSRRRSRVLRKDGRCNSR